MSRSRLGAGLCMQPGPRFLVRQIREVHQEFHSLTVSPPLLRTSAPTALCRKIRGIGIGN